MKYKFKCWVESIKLNELINLEFNNKELEHDTNIIRFSNYNIVDLMISNLPISNLTIFKIDDKLYINEFEFILFIRDFLDNKLCIDGSDLYINDIKNKKFNDLDPNYKQLLLDTLLYCNIIDLSKINIDLINKIINKYIN